MKCLQSNDERVRGADHQERGEVQGEEDGLHQPLVPLYHCGHQPATGKLLGISYTSPCYLYTILEKSNRYNIC